MKKEERLKHYLERHIRWTAYSSNQLTFFNNILVTLAIAFISFAFNTKKFEGLGFSSEVNWSITFSILSLSLAVLSAVTGIYFSFNRLYDFLLSRHLNLIRYRMLKYHNLILDATSYGKQDEINGVKKWFLSFNLLKGSPFKIEVLKDQTGEEIEKARKSFIEMRKTTYNLGLVTGKLLAVQVYSFILSLLAYLLRIFCS